MGTNYYIREHPPCPTCGCQAKPKHIGKSSVGWLFMLRVYPEEGINTYADWYERFTRPGVTFKDEYDRPVILKELVHTITNRTLPLMGNPAEEGCTYEYVDREFS